MDYRVRKFEEYLAEHGDDMIAHRRSKLNVAMSNLVDIMFEFDAQRALHDLKRSMHYEMERIAEDMMAIQKAANDEAVRDRARMWDALVSINNLLDELTLDAEDGGKVKELMSCVTSNILHSPAAEVLEKAKEQDKEDE